MGTRRLTQSLPQSLKIFDEIARLTLRNRAPTLSTMRLVNHAKLSPHVLIALEQALPDHHTLLEVVTWGLGQQPPLSVAEAVTQDEFTHDLIVPWRDSLVLVYGAT